MPSAQHYFDLADKRLTFLRQQALELSNADTMYSEAARKFGQLLDRTWRELVGYLLPEVDEATLLQLQERLKYPGLVPIRAEFEARLGEAVKRRLQLESMEEVAHREIVEAPLHDQLAEVGGSHDAMRDELEWWHLNRWHSELSLNGFFDDTPPRGIALWFKNWRAGSFLMRDAERHLERKFGDPGELKTYYRRLVQDFQPLRDLVTRTTERLQEIASLNEEHVQLQQSPTELGKKLYEDLGGAIRDHVESAPTEALYETATGDEHLIMFFKKISGLERQESYLEQLRVVRIRALRDSLNQQIQKLERKVRKRRAKFWRGKFRYVTQQEYDGLSNFKEEKWAKRHARLDKLRHRITSFDRYHDGSFGDHYLWWDAMTKGAPADDIYEVRTYRERYGDFADTHPHLALEESLGEWAADDELLADAADAMAEDMLAGSDDWTTDAS